ncbi:hypothetical protein G4B88_021604 [Cannabis sativa]|uniref:Transmembrane protein n=1 Tax=Cannabis sativa TaxID=3483 RepID=A0A7J6GIW3_CANSA|nr:hypothetical protein G4B88_021604 [Cannabis sativa]
MKMKLHKKPLICANGCDLDGKLFERICKFDFKAAIFSFCALISSTLLSVFFIFLLMRLAKAPSALANSLHSLTPSQATLLDFITLETNDQLFALDDFDSETKETIDSKTLKVINSTSLNMLTISAVCSSFLRDEVLNLDLFSMALESAFFIIFLELKNFLTSLERLISPPCFLRIAD